MFVQQMRPTFLTVVLMASCLAALARDPVAVEFPTTPDGTVKTVVKALGEGQFEVLWQALPPSYQTDVKKLLVEFSKKMDADLWSKGHRIVGSAAMFFNDKTDLILGTALFGPEWKQAMANKPEEVKKFLTSIGGLLSALHSVPASLSEVEKLDVEKLLANIGPKFRALNEASAQLDALPAGANMKDLLKLEVKLIRSTADAASLELTQADGRKIPEEYVRVEGKWLPKKMADEWPTKIAEAHKAIAALEIKPEKKQQARKVLDLVDSMFDKLLWARTQGEFESAFLNGSAAVFQELEAQEDQAEPK